MKLSLRFVRIDRYIRWPWHLLSGFNDNVWPWGSDRTSPMSIICDGCSGLHETLLANERS